MALVQARQGGQKMPQQQFPQLEPHPQTLCSNEMLCMVTDLPMPQPSPMYTLIGNANFSGP